MFTAFGTMYRAACDLLPDRMNSPEAFANLYAIAGQESKLDERRQIGGPARGFWQFEFGGIKGVLTHPASKPVIRSVLDRLDYDYSPDTSYVAIEHNDVLAFAYARCLLWTIPDALSTAGESERAWRQYLEAWRPGKPHRSTWDAHYARAWVAALKPPTRDA